MVASRENNHLDQDLHPCFGIILVTSVQPESPMKKTKTPASFATRLAELESIIGRLESSDTSLEDSLKEFESAMTLIREAQTSLQQAEQKVQLLVEQHGELSQSPFVGDEETE